MGAIKAAYILVMTIAIIIILYAIGHAIWVNRHEAVMPCIGVALFLFCCGLLWAICERYDLVRIVTKTTFATLGLCLFGGIVYCMGMAILT